MKFPAAIAQLNSDRVAVVVGLGLIGRAVAQSLLRRSALQLISHEPCANFWSQPDRLLGCLSAHLELSDSASFELIWSAGKAGFASSEAQTAKELNFFSECMRVLQHSYGDRLTLNFISSAGALYGGDHVDLTAYGKLKQQQERCLKELGIQHRVFRVGTVYDAPASGLRLGLIAKMIRDTQLGLPTTLYASAHTRRDFLLVDDVANYLVQAVLNNANGETKVLVSGRAVSLHTLVLMLEKLLKRKIKVNFMNSTHNDADLLFTPLDLPGDFKVSSLEEGLRLVVNRSQTSPRQFSAVSAYAG